jgi:5'-3' exonuclease
MSNKVLIFDGTNTFHRNFVVNPTADVNGEPIGGIIGTIRSIKYMIAETSPDKVIFVWDGDGGSKKRRGIVSEYKMGRKPRLNREVEEGVKNSRDNFVWQSQKLKKLLPFLGVTQIEIDDIEADDTIGYLVGCLDPCAKVVVSSDRDMWQLVSDTTVIYWPTKKVYISKGTFKDQTPILPENYVLARAMAMGDNSDNIKAIKGLGEKTLLKLFPVLTKEEVTQQQLNDMIRRDLERDQRGELKPKLTASQKRWFQVVLDSTELVSRNVEVMQLRTPNISAQAATIIRNAASLEPSFNMTGFKMALINNQIQVTDNELFPVFQAYKARTQNAA